MKNKNNPTLSEQFQNPRIVKWIYYGTMK